MRKLLFLLSVLPFSVLGQVQTWVIEEALVGSMTTYSERLPYGENPVTVIEKPKSEDTSYTDGKTVLIADVKYGEGTVISPYGDKFKTRLVVGERVTSFILIKNTVRGGTIVETYMVHKDCKNEFGKVLVTMSGSKNNILGVKTYSGAGWAR